MFLPQNTRPSFTPTQNDRVLSDPAQAGEIFKVVTIATISGIYSALELLTNATNIHILLSFSNILCHIFEEFISFYRSAIFFLWKNILDFVFAGAFSLPQSPDRPWGPTQSRIQWVTGEGGTYCSTETILRLIYFRFYFTRTSNRSLSKLQL
jgi:hypothetical protein